LGHGGLFDPSPADHCAREGDVNAFRAIQPNPPMPPYKLGVTPTTIELHKVVDMRTMTLKSDMFNGSVANFTLVKKQLDTDKLPVVTKPDGSVYVCGFFN